ncbi:hypothetical protein MAM1_0142d06442 [Mucor ambiguus]|uniref:Shugoshin C-terminal domain-containing protein n=1 Tax=Mucor ambiguus TaxID=91626 RepID=A0A0C9MU62_9FUNG|nr:hypothetical protein MAM1_0142d06442 [Mucor ambiguus]
MNIPKKPYTQSEYKNQNEEIIKANTRLNERIAMLERLVSQLQQENLQLRIDKAKKHKRKKKVIPKKRVFSAMNPPQLSSQPQPSSQSTLQENIPTDSSSNSKEHAVNDLIITTHTKRSCSSKPISYVLPSTKCKLRKGDPHTFGNE